MTGFQSVPSNEGPLFRATCTVRCAAHQGSTPARYGGHSQRAGFTTASSSLTHAYIMGVGAYMASDAICGACSRGVSEDRRLRAKGCTPKGGALSSEATKHLDGICSYEGTVGISCKGWSAIITALLPRWPMPSEAPRLAGCSTVGGSMASARISSLKAVTTACSTAVTATMAHLAASGSNVRRGAFTGTRA